jgi:hypothetical protein
VRPRSHLETTANPDSQNLPGRTDLNHSSPRNAITATEFETRRRYAELPGPALVVKSTCRQRVKANEEKEIRQRNSRPPNYREAHADVFTNKTLYRQEPQDLSSYGKPLPRELSQPQATTDLAFELSKATSATETALAIGTHAPTTTGAHHGYANNPARIRLLGNEGAL